MQRCLIIMESLCRVRFLRCFKSIRICPNVTNWKVGMRPKDQRPRQVVSQRPLVEEQEEILAPMWKPLERSRKRTLVWETNQNITRLRPSSQWSRRTRPCIKHAEMSMGIKVVIRRFKIRTMERTGIQTIAIYSRFLRPKQPSSLDLNSLETPKIF